MMRNWFIPIASKGAAPGCVAVLALALSAQAAPPQRVEIAYEVARNGTAVAEVTGRLEHDGRRYRLEESWKGKGMYALRGDARRASRGAVAADGLHPAEFEDHRPGRDPRRVAFDPGTAASALRQQDRLSFIWNFAFAPPRAESVVNVADGRRVTTYVYRTAGRERIRVPAGEFDALKLVKKKEHPEDRGAELWLAADRSYLPVRILVTERDGTRLDQVAVRIRAP
jgi:hypothetical protein